MTKRRPRAPRHRREHGVLERILTTPQLARVVPHLQPEVLHRVIQHVGLEDSGPLMALATPEQVARVFDLDLWRPPAPGLDEQFDGDRFGQWLDVMVDGGVSSAAALLASMDIDVVAAGFLHHVRVFENGAVASFTTLDGDLVPEKPFAGGVRCEVGGYVVTATRGEHWDSIAAALTAMADTHQDAFADVMGECCRRSHSRPEADGLDELLFASDQGMFDLAVDREARRDTQGYVTPADARAFLHASRRIDLRHGAVPSRDAITQAYFRNADIRDPPVPTDDAPAEAVAAIIELLDEAGVMPRAPRRLLESPQGAARLARIRAQLQFAEDHDPRAFAARSAELAYLANVIAAGTTIQSRPVAADEASNAALAVCNLGLENWPGPDQSEDVLLRRDLVSVFQVGWTVLHENVCMYAADELIATVTSLDCADGEVQAALGTLRVTLIKYWRAGTPWRSRDALDVIARLDTPSWAALLGLIDEFPTLHAAVGASLSGTTQQIDASAFEFIAENAQIQRVREFMQRLPGRLRN